MPILSMKKCKPSCIKYISFAPLRRSKQKIRAHKLAPFFANLKFKTNPYCQYAY